MKSSRFRLATLGAAVFASVLSSASFAQTTAPASTAKVYVIGSANDDAGTYGFKRVMRTAVSTGPGSTQLAPDYVWANMTKNPAATTCSYYNYNWSTGKFKVNPACTNYASANAVMSKAFANGGTPSITKQIEDLSTKTIGSDDIIFINQGAGDFAVMFGLLGNLGEASKPIQTLIKTKRYYSYNGRTYNFTGCAAKDSNFLNQNDMRTFAGGLQAVNANVAKAQAQVKGLMASVLGQDYVDENMDGREEEIGEDIKAIYMGSVVGGFVRIPSTGETYWDSTGCGLLGWWRSNDPTAQQRILSIMGQAQIDGKEQIAKATKDYMIKSAQLLRETIDQKLIAKGAKKIVIFNLPAVELTPKFKRNFADMLKNDGPDAVAENKKLVSDAIAAYNAELSRLFAKDPNIAFVDSYWGLKLLIEDHKALGLNDVTNAFCPPFANGSWSRPAPTLLQQVKNDKAMFDNCTLEKGQQYLQSKKMPTNPEGYGFADEAYPMPILHKANGLAFLIPMLKDKGWIK